jgi:hypothetical protein
MCRGFLHAYALEEKIESLHFPNILKSLEEAIIETKTHVCSNKANLTYGIGIPITR